MTISKEQIKIIMAQYKQINGERGNSDNIHKIYSLDKNDLYNL